MNIEAKVIADSLSPKGDRLRTMQLRYPKLLHSEAKTHRKLKIGDRVYEFLEDVSLMNEPAFSRSASSSRAIPVWKLLEEVRNNPAMPVVWLKNKPGMQAEEPMTPEEEECAREIWLRASRSAADLAESLAAAGLHKQWVNRIIEPYTHINVIVTATEWNNFFALRRHEHAQPEMKVLADAMWDAQQASIPTPLKPGQWHLPYVDVDADIRDGMDEKVLIKLSVARCARVSYLTHEGKKPTVEDDLKLYDRLLGSKPLHASPAEHQATPDTENAVRVGLGERTGRYTWDHPHQHGNLIGWRQYRKMLKNESVPG
ncbi:unnamed protein product [Sphagnum jensenii]|uniref:Uncharacterized protein n=1 Tax=Sphagnum jensenii TaxID=128206 RepID=A0ABP0VK05_9BRYO